MFAFSCGFVTIHYCDMIRFVKSGTNFWEPEVDYKNKEEVLN